MSLKNAYVKILGGKRDVLRDRENSQRAIFTAEGRTNDSTLLNYIKPGSHV